MIRFLLYLLSPLTSLCGLVFQYAFRTVLILVVLVALAVYGGYFHRYLHYAAEQEASKALNDTKVTIGSIKADLWRGKCWLTDVIVHSPQRAAWQWASPLFCRIGKVYLETNLVYVIICALFLQEEPPLEIHTLHASDIQGFLERRQHIYNFHLLDAHNILPDPATLDDDEDTALRSSPPNGSPTHDNDNSFDDADDTTRDKEAAQKLMEDVVRAVHDIGKAARRGSLHESLSAHRSSIKVQLRALQSSKKSDALDHGVKMAREVSKAVVETTQNVAQAVAPQRRELTTDVVVYARFGRVILEELRLFTRGGGTTEWQKPILMQRCLLRPSDFAPPSHKMDEQRYPQLYQPLDIILDLIMKRVLADIAKNNSSRLAMTLLGEMMDLLDTTTSTTANLEPSSSNN